MGTLSDLIQHLINGMSLGAVYGLVALGYTMVYGVLQLINFAHSEVYMLGAFAVYYTAILVERILGHAPQPSLFLFIGLLVSAMLCCSLVGILIERLAYRPLRQAPRINTLITAIGVSLLLQYGGQVVFGADPKTFPTVLEDRILFTLQSIEFRMFDIAILGVGILLMFALHYLVHHTRMGQAMRAVSLNPQVARLMGIDTDRIVSMTFVIGSSLAGAGALLIGMRYPKLDPLMGTLIGIKAFVAAVLGGIGNLRGAVLGALIMGISEEMVVAYFSSSYREPLAFTILILILLFRPEGLLGQVRPEKV